MVHESIAYSHWLPYQPSQCNDGHGVVFMEESWDGDIRSGNRPLLHCTVIWSVWMVHESTTYSHWLPCQPSQCNLGHGVGFVKESWDNDFGGKGLLLHCTVVWSFWMVHESIAYSHWLPYQPSQCNDGHGVVFMEESWDGDIRSGNLCRPSQCNDGHGVVFVEENWDDDLSGNRPLSH